MKTFYASLLALFLFSSPAWATTYYVATTGSNSNPGTSGSPFRSCQKGMSVLVAGDTLIFKDGTYKATDVTGGDQAAEITCYIRGTYVNGTAQNPITLKPENWLGATIELPSTSSGGTGFHVARNYWVIQGFNITSGTSPNNGSSTAYHGVKLTTGSNGTVVRRNHIHDIGRTVCSSSGFGYTGIYMDAGVNDVIEYNRIHAIGRLRNGESGCSTSLYQNDHGLYLHAGSGLIVRYNVIYDANRGYPIQLYGGTMTNTTIVHNSIGGHAPSSSTFCGGSLPCPRGQIIFGMDSISNTSTATIKNNIFWDAGDGPLTRSAGSNCTAITYDYNYTDNADSDMWNTFNGAIPACATDGGHNLKSQADPFTSYSTSDFTIAPSAAVINAGTALTGYAYQSVGPTIGAFQPFKCNASATVNGNNLDTTCAMNVNTPVIAGTGTVALLSAVARTTTSTAVLAGTDSVLRSVFDGAACLVGGAWTNSVTGTITITDSALIGGSLNQKALASTAISVTNNCAASQPDTFTPVASSTFTASVDENPLSESASWSTIGTVGTVFKLDSATDTALTSAFGQDSRAAYTGLSFSANQYSRADITTVSTAGAGTGQGLCVRCAIASESFYGFHIDHAASNNAEIMRKVNGAYTSLVRWTQAFTNADTFTLAVYGETVYVYDKTSALVQTYVDTGGGVPNSGSPGISFSSTTSSGTFVDNWVGGNFSNTPTPPATGTYTQKETQFYQAYLTGGLPVAVGTLSGNITMTRPNLSFSLVTQLDCTVGDCDPVGLRLRYSRNGGPYLEVPDTLGADQIAFFGLTSDTTVLSGAVSCCLSGALTANAGTTQTTSAATPIIDLAQNASTVNRRILTLGSSAVATDTYDFREYSQTGVALTAYTVTPRVTVGSTSLSVPTSFRATGSASNTAVTLIWAPVTDTDFAGYRVYRGTAPGVYGSTPICNNTASSVALTTSSITSCQVSNLTGATYYYIVRSVDTGGNQSAASSELTIASTGFTTRTTR